MLESPTQWQEAWAQVPNVKDDSWKQNLANYIDSRLSGKLTTSTLFSSPGTGAMSFTFGKAAFLGALSSNSPSSLSTAFKAGLLASTILVSPGAFIGSDSPASKFSVVSSAQVLPPSAEAAATKVLEVQGLPSSKEASKSQFPLKLREASLLLQVVVSGMNSVTPPAGPQPLSLAAGGVQ